jgi:hypothetical protein
MKAQSKYYKNFVERKHSSAAKCRWTNFCLETNRDITAAILQSYLPSEGIYLLW